jgi:hypothetical protein
MISLGNFCNFSEILSLSQPLLRFIRCSLNIKLVTFYSGHVFYKFSEILSLVLSPEHLKLLLSWRASVSSSFSLISVLSSLQALSIFPPEGGSGPVLFLLSEETRVSLGLQENCTLWYFGLTVFCLLSQTLHASIHGGS